MADDTSLLLRIRGDSAGAKQAVAETRAAISSLRQSSQTEFNQIQQASTTALSKVSASLTDLSNRVPVVGSNLSGVANTLGTVSQTLRSTTPVSKEFSASVDAIAKSSGKTRAEITQFLSTFSKLEGAAAKNEAAFKAFGGTVDLIGNKTAKFLPELETAAAQLSEVGTSTASASAAFSAMLGPIGLVVAAYGVAAVAAASLTKELIALAVAAADTQGKLFDLSQQTGVSVETLSALDLLAKQTGGNIESLSASLGIFQKNLEEASDPTSKQAELFKQLGVEITTTEETLRATLTALAKMPEGFQQTAFALQAFGRGGRQFLAILKESHGDIDQTIRELQGMGLASGENAKRADEFNDELVKLQTQLTGLQVTIGNQVIPAVLDALKELDRFLKENKESIDALAFAAKFFAESLSGQLRLALLLVTPQLKAQEGVVRLLADAYKVLAAAAQLASGNLPDVSATAIPPQQLGKPESGQALLDFLDRLRVQQEQAKQFGLKPFNLEEIFGLKKAKESIDPSIQLLKQLQNEVRGLENATKAEVVAAELLDEKYKDINPTIKERILVTARLIDQIRQNIETEKLLAEEEEKRKREIEEAGREITQFLQQQAEDLARLKGETKSAADVAAEFIRQMRAIPGALKASDESWIKFNATLIDSANHLKEINEQLRQVAENTPQIAPEGIGTPGPFTGGIFDEIPPDAEERFRGLQAALDDLGASMGNLVGASDDFGRQFGDVVGGAIDELAFGIGDLVQQWVLLGDTGPAAMRRLTASVLAGLAAQAAVKAIFQLAEGFAALFFNPAEAAAHFTSAALFGSIAGAAAIAGRAVAGDTFKQPAFGGSGRDSRNGPNQINPVTLERNRGQAPQPFVIQVKVQQDRHSIVDVFADDFRRGGITREIVNNDGGVNA